MAYREPRVTHESVLAVVRAGDGVTVNQIADAHRVHYSTVLYFVLGLLKRGDVTRELASGTRRGKQPWAYRAMGTRR